MFFMNFHLISSKMSFSYETNMVTLLNPYRIRIVCVRTVNMPTESQIKNMNPLPKSHKPL